MRHVFVGVRGESHKQFCPQPQEMLSNFDTQMFVNNIFAFEIVQQNFAKQLHFANKLFYTLPKHFLNNYLELPKLTLGQGHDTPSGNKQS